MSPQPGSEGARPPRARRILGALALILPIALITAWYCSRAMRLGVYAALYPAAPPSLQRPLLERVRWEEARSSVLSWELWLGHGPEAAEGWRQLRDKQVELREGLPLGLETLVLAAALDADHPAREDALAIAAAGRVREPRLAPLLIERLDRIPWFGEALGHVGGEPEAARRALDRVLDGLERARQRYEGRPRSAMAGVGELDTLAVQDAIFLLRGYAGLGPAAGPSLEKIRRWRGCADPAVDDAAALALWRCAGDRDALAQLERRFEAADGYFVRLEPAWNLVLAGRGDEACSQLFGDGLAQGVHLHGLLYELQGLGLSSPKALNVVVRFGGDDSGEVARHLLEELPELRRRRWP